MVEIAGPLRAPELYVIMYFPAISFIKLSETTGIELEGVGEGLLLCGIMKEGKGMNDR
jgi:hypothetical protein